MWFYRSDVWNTTGHVLFKKSTNALDFRHESERADALRILGTLLIAAGIALITFGEI